MSSLNSADSVKKKCEIKRIAVCVCVCVCVYLLRKGQRCYHCARKTQITEKIFKLTPHIHAFVIYQIL